jgi:prophage antirepressor-like protein
MSALQVFNFSETNSVRVHVDEKGAPWWVAKDVCDILEIANSRDALARLDEDERGVVSTDTLGGSQNVSAVNEPGLYSLILGSRKPEAKAFKRWVTHEVLPALRRTGSYAMPTAKLERLDIVPRVVKAFKSGLVGKAEARATLGLPPEAAADEFFGAKPARASQSPQSSGQRSLFESQAPHRRGTTLRAKLAAWRSEHPDVFQVDAGELMVELGIAPDAETAGSMFKVRASVSAELRKLGVESQSPLSQSPIQRGDLDARLAEVDLVDGCTIAEVIAKLGLPNTRSNQTRVGYALKRAGWSRRRATTGQTRPYQIFLSPINARRQGLSDPEDLN